MVLGPSNWPEKAKENYRFSVSGENKIRYAHPLDRISAFLIDLAILFLLCSLTIAPIQKKLQIARWTEDQAGVFVLIIWLIFLVGIVSVLYHFFLNHFSSGTFGKRMMGLRVVSVHSMERPSWSDHFVRACLWWVDTALLCLPHFSVYSDPMRRTFHDRVSNTVVVSTTRRYANTPSITEGYLIRSLFVTFYLIGGLLVFLEFTELSENMRLGQEFGFSALDTPVRCDTVTDAHDSWPMEQGLLPKRMSVALALFASGEADEECLDQEAYFSFKNKEQIDLAYLARAFTTSDDSELSDRYLSRVCEEFPAGEACEFSELINLWTQRKWDEATLGFSKMLPLASVFVKVWAIKHFEKIKMYSKENEIIDGLWPLPALSGFLTQHKAVALWGVGKYSESRVAMKTSLENMNSDKQIGLSSWFCYQEMEWGCPADEPASCQMFKKLTHDNPMPFSLELHAMTDYKIKECSNEEMNVSDLESVYAAEDTLKFIKLATEINESTDAYARLLSEVDEQGIVAHEIRKRMIMAIKNPKDVVAQLDEWQAADPIHQWNWVGIGEQLMSKLESFGDAKSAFLVAEKILERSVDQKVILGKAINLAESLGEDAKLTRYKSWLNTSERAVVKKDNTASRLPANSGDEP